MTISWFELAILAVAVVGGATAAIAGFGIGSLLTPIMALRMDMTTAVAAVAIPHALATMLRCWRLRRSIDWMVLRSFGVLSAGGALVGAVLYTRFSSAVLTMLLGVLLVATGLAGWTNWMRRWRPDSVIASAFGFASGLFGGVAGNQGGLRAAALLTFSLTPSAFVATSTAVALVVDAVRTPVYVWKAGPNLTPLGVLIGLASLGVIVGTILGERVLLGLGVDRFRRLVSALIGALGIWLIGRSL